MKIEENQMHKQNLNFTNYFRMLKQYFTKLFCSKEPLRDRTTIINDINVRKFIILTYLQRVYNVDFSLLKMQLLPTEIQESLIYHGDGRYSLVQKTEQIGHL
jgi:hypothetical protein